MSKPNGLQRFRRFIAFEFDCVSPAEILVATLGGVIGITLISIVSYQVTGQSGAALIVPSMGASAVLLFAVPHGKLSQPWSLVGGHVISAIIGVACYQFIPNLFLAAGLAVGLAIGAMHITRSIHPPGGATALAAVIGGAEIHQLGYAYVLSPILLNVILLLVLAILFNSVFPWRRYPVAAMMRFTEQPKEVDEYHHQLIDKQAIEQAIADMDLVMDVTTEDLQRVIQLSLKHAEHQTVSIEQLKLGHYYTNGKHGVEWSVRRIIDESTSVDNKHDMLIYRVVEGQCFNSADSSTREAFANWAAREVFPNDDSAEDVS